MVEMVRIGLLPPLPVSQDSTFIYLYQRILLYLLCLHVPQGIVILNRSKPYERHIKKVIHYIENILKGK
jgi:hypothetical protein